MTTLITEINAGELLLELFYKFIEFFTTLYKLMTYEIPFPQWLENIVRIIFPAINIVFPVDIPDKISVIALLGVAGVPIAFALGIYYIVKGAI
ncbi:MAG: hypothetical protein J6Q89_04625 [Clostridia bacterium]|nr:hypothetical protein [Clostridia bacterium]